MNQILKKGMWPSKWKESIIFPIKKKEDWNKDFKLTRPITLIETTRIKLMVKILTRRLSEILRK